MKFIKKLLSCKLESESITPSEKQVKTVFSCDIEKVKLIAIHLFKKDRLRNFFGDYGTYYKLIGLEKEFENLR